MILADSHISYTIPFNLFKRKASELYPVAAADQETIH